MKTASLILLLVASSAVAAQTPYVRAGIGYERSGGTAIRDLDCGATAPPALFGCAEGADQRPLGARGDFGGAAVWELAAGVETGRWLRGEIVVSQRTLDLDAEANFIGVSGEQPVAAEGRSLTALLAGAVNLAPESWRVRPFLVAGAGVARNDLNAVTYAFPGIAAEAVTVIRGGVHNTLASMWGAGVTIPLTASADLDVSWRWLDAGEVRTESGPARIVRPRGTLDLDIAGTRGGLKTSGVTVAIRYRP